jgi:hypothetical protein
VRTVRFAPLLGSLLYDGASDIAENLRSKERQ